MKRFSERKDVLASRIFHPLMATSIVALERPAIGESLAISIFQRDVAFHVLGSNPHFGSFIIHLALAGLVLPKLPSTTELSRTFGTMLKGPWTSLGFVNPAATVYGGLLGLYTAK